MYMTTFDLSIYFSRIIDLPSTCVIEKKKKIHSPARCCRLSPWQPYNHSGIPTFGIRARGPHTPAFEERMQATMGATGERSAGRPHTQSGMCIDSY